MKPDANARRKWDNEPLVLFVEGYSDLTFYAEAMEHIGLFARCFIQDLGGKGRNKLSAEASLLLKPRTLEKVESVAVILDADDNAEGAFRLARSALRDAVGVELSKAGEWVTPPQATTRFGAFIVGGDKGQVEIESLAWAAWTEKRDNAAFRGCVEEFVKCAAAKGRRLQSIDKVRVGATLSVLNEDDPRLGPGARANVFDFESTAFAPLLAFLRGMSPPSSEDAVGSQP